MTSFRWGAATHPGRIRPVNQDAVHAEAGLFVVADGMGGHRAGDTAAQLTVDTIVGHPRSQLDELIAAISSANQRVHEQAADNEDLAGMGTTVCALVLAGGDTPLAHLVNVGDSRAYRLRNGELAQLTLDHSYVGDLLRQGAISEAEAEAHPYRNMLTRAIGIEPEVEVDHWTLELADGDRFLLCSDGLTNELNNNQIVGIMRRLADPGEAARELIRQANERGGRDNITVVVVDIGDRPEAHPTAELAAAENETQPDVQPEAEPDTAALPEERAAHEQSSSTEPVIDPTLATIDQLAPDDPLFGDGPQLHERPLLTWRSVAFSFALVGLAVAVFAAIGFYARSGTHLAFSPDDELVVYQGQPGGLLWFEPSVAEHTGLFRSQLTEAGQEVVGEGRTVDSVSDGLAMVEQLRTEALVAPDTGTADTNAPDATTTDTSAPETSAVDDADQG